MFLPSVFQIVLLYALQQYLSLNKLYVILGDFTKTSATFVFLGTVSI